MTRTGAKAAVVMTVGGVLVLGLGVYEIVHIHHEIVRVNNASQQLLKVFGGNSPQAAAHVGWGVYAVAIAGLVAVGAAVWSLTTQAYDEPVPPDRRGRGCNGRGGADDSPFRDR